MSKKPFITKSKEDVKLVFDPYRLRIIYVVEQSKEPLTVKEIAAKLNEPANKVHYHVRKLADFGYFELVKTKLVNGITAKYYDNVFVGPFFGNEARSYDDFPEMIKDLANVMDLISEDFKNDLVSYANLKDENGVHPGGGVSLDHQKLYMTPEQAAVAARKVAEVLAPYTKEDESLSQYGLVLAFARTK